MKLNLSTRAYKKKKLCPAGGTAGLAQGRRSGSPVLLDSSRVRGFTLPEMMVTMGVGMLIMTVIAMVFTSSARSFAAMGNYVDMDASSRNALDHMTREVRQAGKLIEYTSTHLAFTAPGQTNSFLVYDWDSGTRRLTEWKTGYAATNTLLTECDALTFSLFNSSFTSTTNLSAGKALSVNWKCSRTILGRMTTEDMQQALIVIRNKPL